MVNRKPTSVRSALWAWVVASAVTVEPRALADDAETCAAAHDAVAPAHEAGQLLRARESAIACARACELAGKESEVLQRNGARCQAEWLPRLEADIPTIVLAVRDTQGRETTGFRVELDGKPLTQGAEGKAVEVDPGSHTLRFFLEGQAPITVTTVLRQGERNKVVEASFQDRAPQTQSPPGGSSVDPGRAASGPPSGGTPEGANRGPTGEKGGGLPLWPFLVGGGGLVLGGVAAGLAVSSLASTEQFYELCPLDGEVPLCGNPADLAEANSLRDGIRVRHPAAIGLGAAGGALLVTGIIGLIASPRTSSPGDSAFLVLPQIAQDSLGLTFSGGF